MNKMNTIFRLIVLIVFGWIGIGQALYAQQVSGTVTDTGTGEALPGVNIKVKGTTTGTFTDNEGHYELDVASLQDTLVFSFVGYQRQEVRINGRNDINVAIKQQALSGEELVVVGYSAQRKKDITGSVEVVNTEDLQKQPATDVTKQLQGQASGVTVTSSGQPGEQPMVHIRGFNTFGNNTPLYVVDGVPTQDISNLNSDNVASIQVLKDAGAASIYGSRASNGVVIITTKRGQKGKVHVNFKTQYGWQQPKQDNVWHILSPIDQARLRWRAIENSGGNPRPDPLYGKGDEPRLPDYIAPAGAMEGDPSVDPKLYNVDPYYTDPSVINSFYYIDRANKEGTDWYHQIFHTEPRANSNLTVSGGGEQGSYLLALNYDNQLGTLMNTYLKRYNIRVNTDFNVSKNIQVGENLSYSLSHNLISGTLQESSDIAASYRTHPIIPVHDIMGNWAGGIQSEISGVDSYNPVASRYRTRNNKQQGNRLFGNIYANLDFYKYFTLHTSFGGELNSDYDYSFSYPEYEGILKSTTNSFQENSNHAYNWTWTNTLTFNNTFAGIHNLKVVIGTEAYENAGTFVGGLTQDYFSFNPDYTNLSTGSGTTTNNSYTFKNGLFSLIGRIDYSFKDKYLFGATIRRDGSSKLLNYRYGWFPAVSLGWRISNEKFMEGISWLSDLKIRGSYGVLGNQLNIAADNAYTLYGGAKTISYYDIRGTNNSVAQGFYKTRIGNPNAKWEKDVNTNIGIDASIFNDKFQLTADYYNKDIRDLLFNPPLIGAAGNASPPFKNVARMTNYGLDASLKSRGSLIGDLNYNASLTVTTYHNEIDKISDDNNYFSLDSRRFNGSSIIRNAVGHPVSSYFGYNVVGFWNSQSELDQANSTSPDGTYQTDAGVGRFRYQDTNGDKQITPEDRKFLGSPNPKFSYGFNVGLDYKNFDVSAFFYGVQGKKIWNQVRWWTDFYASFQTAKSHTALYNSWTSQNHDATAPIQESEGTFSTNGVPNSYFVEDGSYLKIKNIVLGYTVPSKIVSRLNLEKLRVYVQAANLFTFTKYSGIAPEIGGGGVTDYGIDEGAYTTPRQLLIGINLSF